MARLRVIKELPAEGPVPCPRKGCDGSIVEVDVAVRWNDLEVYPATDSVPAGLIASVGRHYQFDRRDRHPFICNSCCEPVQFPDRVVDTIDYG